jgi:hypothetical protein
MADVTQVDTEQLDENGKPIPKYGQGNTANTLAARLKASGGADMAQYEKLLNDPQYQISAPPESKATLAAAVDKARENYKTETNKNDWLEVAQMLGRAGAQYAAGRAGENTGRDMNLNLAPGIDYEKRNVRAEGLYGTETKNAENLTNQERLDYANSEKAKEEQLRRRTGFLEANIKNRQEPEIKAATIQGAQDVESVKAAAERERLRHKQAEDDARLSEQEKKDELRDLDRQEKSLADKLKARIALTTQLGQEDDLGSKEVGKLQEKYGSLAGAGDLDLGQLQDEMSKATKPGMLWGTNPDPEKQHKVLQEHVDEVRNMLQGIAQRKQELLSKTKGGGSSVPPPQKSQAPAGKVSRAQLTEYSKAHSMAEPAAADFLKSQGYEVEQ